MNNDIKVIIDAIDDIGIKMDTGSIQYGQLQIGETKTGEPGTKAIVTNSGTPSRAILNFTIPRGKDGVDGTGGTGGTTDYHDLENKPSINNVELSDNKTLDELGIQPKGSYATESFVTNKIAEAQLGGEGGSVDLSGYATKDEVNNKVDKVNGKSLILDTEIERLSKVDNYDDTEIKELINAKANTSAIPTKVSQLTNDKNYLTSIPSEYITETELNNKGYLTSVPNEYVTETELEEKNYATETYVTNKIAEAGTGGSGGSTNSTDNYSSTEEIVIGTWIDGKPIYRKVFDCGALPNAVGQQIPTGDLKIDTLVNIWGTSEDGGGTVITLPYVDRKGQANVTLYYHKGVLAFIIGALTDMTTYTKTYVVLEYTKTTD